MPITPVLFRCRVFDSSMLPLIMSGRWRHARDGLAFIAADDHKRYAPRRCLGALRFMPSATIFVLMPFAAAILPP